MHLNALGVIGSGILGILASLYIISKLLNTGDAGIFLFFIGVFVCAGAGALILKAVSALA